MTIAILPLNTLVCSDTFGLGFTVSRVYRTSACPKGKVEVSFDDDQELSSDDFTGRVRSTQDSEGNTVTTRYRIMLCSFLDWDGEDEAESAEPVVLSDKASDDDKPAEQDELGFDNVEALEAKADEQDEADEAEWTVSNFSRVPRGTVASNRPKLTRRAVKADDEEEQVTADEAALFSEFSAEFDQS